MPKGSSKSIAQIQRLPEERRQYEAWLARLGAATDATPDQVRGRVRADYEAGLEAVIEELKAHAASARQAIEQKKHHRAELQKKEASVAERLTETELRHAVGEYDEAQWSQVHKDVLAELVSVREELQAIDADIDKLQELDALVHDKQPAKAGTPSKRKTPLDEMAFIKSVTEDDKGAAPTPTRASGAVEQPHREGIGLCGRGGGCGLPHVLQRGAQGGALRPVVREAGTRLAHGFLGGLDTRHSGPPGWARKIEGKLRPVKALRC